MRPVISKVLSRNTCINQQTHYVSETHFCHFKGKMASAQWNAGETHGQTQAKTEEWMDSAQNTANKACDQMADSRESAQQGKEQSAGIIQQTGEQVMHMAQGAIDGMKSSLGMNDQKK